MFFQRDKITQSIDGRTNNHWQSACLLLGVTALGNILCLRRKIRSKMDRECTHFFWFRTSFYNFHECFRPHGCWTTKIPLEGNKRIGRYKQGDIIYDALVAGSWNGFANPCLYGSSKVRVLSWANDETSIYEVRNEYMYQIWTEGEWGTVGGCKVVGCRMYHAGAGCRPPPLPRAPRGAAHPQQQHFSLRPGILHLVQRFCHK